MYAFLSGMFKKEDEDHKEEKHEERAREYSDFTDNLLWRLLASQSKAAKHVIISPHSLLCALTLCMNGAKGNTLSQFNKVLYASEEPLSSLEDARAHHQHLCRINNSYTSNEDANILVANHIWLNRKWSLCKEFAELVGASVTSLDFEDTQSVADEINDWVSQHTRRRIVRIIDAKHLDGDDTPLVLTNAMYFKSAFKIPFNANCTAANTLFFADAARRQVLSRKCVMMSGAHPAYHAHCVFADAFDCIKLRYKAKHISLVLVQAKAADGERYFERAQLKAMSECMSSELVHLFVPKFKAEFEFEAKHVLKDMGLTHAFSESRADFSAMVHAAKRMRVHVAHVLHKAVFEVDEKGTVAAAATAVVMNASCGPGGSATPPYVTLRYDYPFQYFIYDEQNDHVLFAGKVNLL